MTEMSTTIPPIVVMGVQGAGKSTIGSLLADHLGVTFIDGDSLHSPENVAMMAAGSALTDTEREPWLREVGRVLAERQQEGIVIACSALKRSYRDLLRESVPDLFVVDPEGTMELIMARIGARQHEFMPAGLLRSQFDTLEPLHEDERGVVVDIAMSPAQIIDAIDGALAVPREPHRAH
jgi:gluconokinase